MKNWKALIMAAVFIAMAAVDRANAATYYMMRNYESETVTFRNIDTTEEIRLPKGSLVSYTSNKSTITASFEVQSSGNGQTYLCSILVLDVHGSMNSATPTAFRPEKKSAGNWSLTYSFIHKGQVGLTTKSFNCRKLYSGR